MPFLFHDRVLVHRWTDHAAPSSTFSQCSAPQPPHYSLPFFPLPTVTMTSFQYPIQPFRLLSVPTTTSSCSNQPLVKTSQYYQTWSFKKFADTVRCKRSPPHPTSDGQPKFACWAVGHRSSRITCRNRAECGCRVTVAGHSGGQSIGHGQDRRPPARCATFCTPAKRWVISIGGCVSRGDWSHHFRSVIFVFFM